MKSIGRTVLLGLAPAFVLTILAADSAGQVQLQAVARIPIDHPGSFVALSPDGSDLYVTEPDDQRVARVSTRSRKLLQSIVVGPAPCALAFAPNPTHVLIGQWGGELGRVDFPAARAQTIQVGGRITDLATSADHATLFLTMCRAGLRKMNMRTGRIDTIYNQFCPYGVAVSPDEKFLWVNFQGGGPGGWIGHDSIARFDADTGRLSGTITGMANVGGRIFVSPDNKTVWADGLDACSAIAYDHVGCPAVPAGIVHVIDTTSLKVIRTLPKSEGGTITLSPADPIAVLMGHRTLLVDSRDFRVLWQSAEHFFDAAFSSDGKTLFATHDGKAEVVVLALRRSS